MRKSAGICTLILVSAAIMTNAQEPSTQGPPKVLVIQREFVKPGKAGLHTKSESAFASAMAGAKWPTHYIALDSMSGQSRALFLVGFPSFEAWEKDNKAFEKGMAPSMEHMFVTDGDLLTSFSQAVFVFDPEYSLPGAEVAHARYFEFTQFHVKPGHRHEFLELAKLYRDGFAKANIPNANWALYESSYGEDNGGYYMAISLLKSLAEVDQNMEGDKKFAETVGPATMKKIAELSASSVQSTQTNLFSVNPKMSYASQEWIQADPFWKPMPAPAAPAAKKPVAQ
ncbi:MAG: hypothetical protein NVS9B15_05150 [Acidobacteriaceae bacterium]